MQKTGVEIAHLISIMVWIIFAHTVVLHVSCGPFLKRASTLRQAQLFTMEMVVGGSFGDVMDSIEQSGYVVSGVRTSIDAVAPKTTLTNVSWEMLVRMEALHHLAGRNASVLSKKGGSFFMRHHIVSPDT